MKPVQLCHKIMSTLNETKKGETALFFAEVQILVQPLVTPTCQMSTTGLST